MTDREIMQQALEALENLQGLCTDAEDGCLEAITIWTPEIIDALRERLAQPEQEPFCYHDGRNIVGKEFADHSDVFPLYTAPQPRQWQGLTDKEAMQICVDCGCMSEDWLTLLDALEAKLRERNT